MKALIITVAVVAALFLGGVSYFLLAGLPEINFQSSLPSPALEDKTTRTPEPAEKPKSEELTMVFTEAEANQEAKKRVVGLFIPEFNLEVKSIDIDFKSGNTVLSKIGCSVYGFSATGTAEAQASAEAGKPKIEVTKINFGAIPVPEATRQQAIVFLEQEIDTLLTQLLEQGKSQGVTLEVREIITTENDMSFKVFAKPSA